MLITIICSIGIIQAIFLILLITEKDQKHNRMLILWMVVMALHLAFYLINYNDWLKWIPEIHILGFSLSLLHAPLFYLYCLSLIAPEKWNNHQLVHLITYFIYNLIILYFYYDPEIQIWVSYGFMQVQGNYPSWLDSLGTPLALSGSIYPLASILLIHKHRISYRSNYSFEEEIKLNWLLNWSIAATTFLLVVYASIYLGVNYSWFKTAWVFQIVSFFLTLYIFFIGYNGLRRTRIFTILEIERSSTKTKNINYDKSGLNHEREKQIAEQLLSHMKTQQSYLNENLTLTELANQLKVSRNHLSQTINNHFKKNFFDFVNDYRVNEVKAKMTSPDFKHYSILGMALSSGFKSKSSFNKAFKKVTGFSPSQYLDRLSEKEVSTDTQAPQT